MDTSAQGREVTGSRNWDSISVTKRPNGNNRFLDLYFLSNSKRNAFHRHKLIINNRISYSNRLCTLFPHYFPSTTPCITKRLHYKMSSLTGKHLHFFITV